MGWFFFFSSSGFSRPAERRPDAPRTEPGLHHVCRSLPRSSAAFVGVLFHGDRRRPFLFAAQSARTRSWAGYRSNPMSDYPIKRWTFFRRFSPRGKTAPSVARLPSPARELSADLASFPRASFLLTASRAPLRDRNSRKSSGRPPRSSAGTTAGPRARSPSASSRAWRRARRSRRTSSRACPSPRRSGGGRRRRRGARTTRWPTSAISATTSRTSSRRRRRWTTPRPPAVARGSPTPSPPRASRKTKAPKPVGGRRTCPSRFSRGTYATGARRTRLGFPPARIIRSVR